MNTQRLTLFVEFKYLGVLFLSKGKWMGRETGVQSYAVTVLLESEAQSEARHLPIYVPTLTYGHDLWIMRPRNWPAVESG